MTYWFTDPQLFLYAEGIGSDDVHLWRCKKPVSSSSSLVVPLKPDDFDYVETVTDYMELLANTIDWDETDYKRLVKYIFERRLLVNGQGFVIAELHKTDEDENKMVDDANKEVPAIYIRSLDVLALKPYIPKLRERPIPFRSVQILEDKDGKAAVMDKNFNIVTKLTARVEHLEAENNTLDLKVKTLEGKVTKLTADLVTQMNALTALQQEVKKNIIINASSPKEVWMNDLTNSEWVGVEGLTVCGPHNDLIIVGYRGTYTVDDNHSNVQARYWYKIKMAVTGPSSRYNYKVVSLEDLTPNKEMARFSPKQWCSFISKGKTYVYQLLPS